VARLCIRPWFHPDQIGRISLFILHKESCQWQHHAHNNMNTPTEWHRPAAYIPRAQPQHMQRIRQLLVSVGASAATCICHAWQKICKMSLGQTLLSFHLVGEAPCMPCVAHRTTNTHTHHQPKRSTGPVNNCVKLYIKLYMAIQHATGAASRSSCAAEDTVCSTAVANR
jgi:hypothetical protein